MKHPYYRDKPIGNFSVSVHYTKIINNKKFVLTRINFLQQAESNTNLFFNRFY